MWRTIKAAFECATAAEIAYSSERPRSKHMAALPEQTGLPRQTLHRALGDEGNPTLDTLPKVIRALVLKLVAGAA